MRRTPDYLTIATVLAPWGFKGEVKVRIDTDFPDRFLGLQDVHVGPEHQEHQLLGFRLHKGLGLVRLSDINTVEDAERLRNQEIQVPTSEAVPLEPGQYYVYQVEGLEVRTEDGQSLGHLTQVLFTGSNPVYVVQGSREVLIPAIPDVVRTVDLEAGCMIIRPLPGLLD
jgi:16S rRNA processing protein RimM